MPDSSTWLAFVGMAVVANMIWAGLSGRLAHRLRGPRGRRAQRRVAGATYLALGALTALSSGRK